MKDLKSYTKSTLINWAKDLAFLVDLFQEKIGRCIMTLTKAILEGEFRDSFSIDGTESGKLNLQLKWTPQTIVRD